MMRWSFCLFVLAEFCRRCETKGTWRGVCSGVPSRVQGQSSWRGQGEPHEAVGFLALGWPKEKANALSGCYFVNCSRAVRLRKGVRVLFCHLRIGHEWINGHEHNPGADPGFWRGWFVPLPSPPLPSLPSLLSPPLHSPPSFPSLRSRPP